MPRCLECKTKFEQYQFNNKFCKQLDCQVAKGLHLLDKGKKQQAKNKQGINKTRSEDKHKNQKNDLKTEIQKLARLIQQKPLYLLFSLGYII